MNVDTLLNDFYAKAFGPAAGTMKKYYERLDWSNMPIFNDHVAALAFRDLKKATTEAAGRPDVLARLDDLKLYMHYFHLKWLFDREKDTVAREKLALEILTHSYKSRHAYMFDWAWIGKWWIGKITNWDPRGKVGDPAKWAYSNPDAPWRDESLYTHDEIESFFQENLEYWQPQKNLVERKFSGDLVPVRFADKSSDPNAMQSANYQGDGVFTTVYAMYSIAGEDLKMRIRPGMVYQDKPPLFYRVEDANEKLVAKGKLPPDKSEHDVTIKVPGPGQYFLDIQDNSGGWMIKAHRDTPLSVKVQGEAVFHNNQGDQTWHFYVPKGTREIHYFPGNHGGSHRLIGPGGEVIATVPHDGKIKTIKVPMGLDGARWSLYGAVRSFWFYNLPNWIGASPNALMVPRDVAVRDGLEIRGQ